MSTQDQVATDVIEQVRRWLDAAAQEKRSGAAERRLAALITDEGGVEFAVSFIDRVVRPEDDRVAARNLRALGRHVPPSLPVWQRWLVRLGGRLGPTFPSLVVPMARRTLRRLVGHLIVDARPRPLKRTLKRLRKSGAALNINPLGEAVLGEDEAVRRRDTTLELLRRPDVDYVSVKVSAVASQISLWAFDETVERVVERLEPLYAAADTSSPTFINLDMEEYRDLALTVEVFTRLLDRHRDLRAGLVLQAYLPDALRTMERLQSWAADRVAHGGAPIKIRVAKGANLPMERVDAALHSWPLATFGSKVETDANYKRVLDWALTPDRVANIRIGVAGQNLFDVAHAHALVKERGLAEGVDFEMLLGMATAESRVIARDVGGVLMYVPVVHPDDFDAAVAYLVRRLDENTHSENFMSAVGRIDRDEAVFARERDRYLASLELVDAEPPATHRVQDRNARPAPFAPSFENTPDSDPSIPAQRAWGRSILDSVGHHDLSPPATVDTSAEVDRMVRQAHASAEAWSATAGHARATRLREAANALERRRADLIAMAAAECAKVLAETDPEVSEAIDFARYYADRAEELDESRGAVFVPRRLTLVTPPWNFPVAICAGSTFAALAAGSGVIVKPAPEATHTARLIVDILHESGLDDVVTLLDVPENDVGRELVSHELIDQVILTGAWQTAELFDSWRPDRPLFAETSGKNALIITENADLDLAAADLAKSAFGHAGQKCSAASLGILVGSVARSERFRRQLIDAVTSMHVSHPHDPRAVIGPVIEPPQGKLAWALTELEPGQSWWVEPRELDERLWTPGVRDGVAPRSRFHTEEFFGPSLGLMAAHDLGEAIAWQNGTDYGLTAGLHSLDETEIETWLEAVEAGNLYVNRQITGAIVQRQPFGGWKRSSVGPGAKAGGPNYVAQLGTWLPSRAQEELLLSPDDVTVPLLNAVERQLPDTVLEGLVRAFALDAREWDQEFGRALDRSELGVETNALRYRPRPGVFVRGAADAHFADLVRVVGAGLRAGAPFTLSVDHDLPEGLSDFAPYAFRERGAEFARRIAARGGGQVRVMGAEGLAPIVDAVGAHPGWHVHADPVTQSGRWELLRFLREQSVSITQHRFGNPAAYHPTLTT